MWSKKVLEFQIPFFWCQNNQVKQISIPVLMKNNRCSHKELNLWCVNWALQQTKVICDALSYTQIYFRWKETAVEDDHKAKKCNKMHTCLPWK